MKKSKLKVVVAMSGGIDSSVAAALLKREGFNVIGVFMKLHNFSLEAERRARKVANFLKITFQIFDFRKEFKERIIKYFLNEYKKGRTPNPCVICNKEIKFGLLLRKALGLNADLVATGHYARLQEKRNKEQGIKYKLLKGKDKKKDQSYFLWMLNQDQLKRILFPIDNLTREEVKDLAKKFRLPVLSTQKSMEICFIKKDINDFLRKYLKEKTGTIIDTQGKVIGKHRGLYFYTIGQRKGIKIAGGPYWVLDKNLKKNTLIVTKNEKDLFKRELIAKNINWISGKIPHLPLKLKVKIRYKNPLNAAIIKPKDKKSIKIVLEIFQKAITPGQSVVFFKNNEVLGGGVIEK